MTFRADGVFLAPTPECNAGDCTWGAREDEGVRIWWGDAGMHVMLPDEPRAERGRVLSGVRSTDKDPCRATFVLRLSSSSSPSPSPPPLSAPAPADAASSGARAGSAAPAAKKAKKAKKAKRKPRCADIFLSVFESDGTTLDAALYDAVRQPPSRILCPDAQNHVPG